ncbi:MAG: hypothetical protein QNJ88_02510 [Acidimicrobiia bacterium]|nr:hypothetical protein [Acidimicrobiia bacterium]
MWGSVGSIPSRRALIDIAVNLVETYLRLTGYLTLSEFEVQRRDADGEFRTVTDVDIMAMRLPGSIYVGDPHNADEGDLLLLEDPVLDLEDDCIDVIIGEVKQGEADLNPGITDHVVLHSMLRRVEWIYDEPLTEVVQRIQEHLVHHSPARGGGRVRTRIVAFGRARVSGLNVITHSHVVSTLLRFFEEHEAAFRPIQFKEPAPAFLRLLLKAGFSIDRSGGFDDA